MRDTGSHRLPPFQAAPVQLPTPPLERLVDRAYRWRTLLGLGLAAVMTAAIVVAAQTQNGDDLQAVGDGAGAERRSAIAAVTEFDGDPGAEATSTTGGERRVNSEVDDQPTDTQPLAPAQTSTSGAPSTSTSAPQATTTTTTDTSAASTTATTGVDGSTTATSLDPTTTAPGGSSSSSAPSSVPDPTVPPETTDTTDTSSSTTSSAPAPVRAEAEDGTLLGTARARADHQGFSGAGFVGDLITEGSGVELVVQAAGGPTPFQVRYSAGPDNGPAGPRTISVIVNGTAVTEAQMRLTASWDDWDVVAGTLDLLAGDNQIVLLWAPGDSGWVNIDYVEIN